MQILERSSVWIFGESEGERENSDRGDAPGSVSVDQQACSRVFGVHPVSEPARHAHGVGRSAVGDTDRAAGHLAPPTSSYCVCPAPPTCSAVSPCVG